MRLVLAFASIMLAAGCSGNSDEESYDTFQACFDDHHNVETLPVDQAIVVCCVDHPIGSAGKNVVCGADSASCTTYVTANLSATSATSSDISTACTTYQTQH